MDGTGGCWDDYYSDDGSFPHSLLSTSKMMFRKKNPPGMMIPPEVYVPRSWHFRPVGGKIGGSIGSRMIEESNREAAGMIV